MVALELLEILVVVFGRLLPKSRPANPELPHARTEGMGVDVEQLGGSSISLNASLCEGQGLFDVGFHGLVER
jgi:hypothetical protein